MINTKSKLENAAEYLARKSGSNSPYFSNEEDCYLLAKKLKRILGKKIIFFGSLHTFNPSGQYLSSYRRNHGEYMFNGHSLSFNFKFSNNEFLRISVGTNNSQNSFEEKLAALSDFYETLSKEYGEPTVFYVTKSDTFPILNMHWSFINKEEEIEKFKSGTYFDDEDISSLIIIGDKKINDEYGMMSNKQKDIISRKLGLPFELVDLLDDNPEEFLKHKKGREIRIPADYQRDSGKKLEKKLKR